MAQPLQGGDGMMGGFPLEQWFYEIPVCTRWWMTAALSASVLVQCHIISPFQLFYSVRAVFFRSQVCPRRAVEQPSKLTNLTTVLAADNDILLLRSTFTRPPLPHLLPPAILAPPRRELRTLISALLMAPHLCFDTPAVHSAHVQHGLPGFGAIEHPHLHLEPQEP